MARCDDYLHALQIEIESISQRRDRRQPKAFSVFMQERHDSVVQVSATLERRSTAAPGDTIASNYHLLLDSTADRWYERRSRPGVENLFGKALMLW